MVVTPETWYRCFWIVMGLVWGVLFLVAARIWLINPLLRAIERGHH